MAASVLSVPMFRALSEAGVPLASGKVFTYAAGTSSLLPSYTDSTAVSKNTNPVILDANGEAAIWLASVPYKIEVRDSADVVQWTMDNVQPESVLAGAEWSLMSDVPTYVDTNTFTVPGNRITTFIQGRRVRATITGSTVDGTINSSAYSSLTTVGVTWDNTGINNTISAVSLGTLATVGADSALQAAISASNSLTSELNSKASANAASLSADAAATSEAQAASIAQKAIFIGTNFGINSVQNTFDAVTYAVDVSIAGDRKLQADEATLRGIVFDIVGSYINEVTAALSPLAKLSGFGVSFGTADGTVVSTTGGFGYDFGNFFGTYVTSTSATPITVTPSNRGAAAAYYFAQV